MARSTTTFSAGEALDSALQSLFRALQAQAVPDSLRSILEQLEDARAAPEPEPVAELA